LRIVSGEKDPVGGHSASVNLLVERCRAQGLRKVTLKYYPGARHEILNETNRDEVQQVILDWMEDL
jgi:alpha-beta hydrolase superfamily lysophospholipase